MSKTGEEALWGEYDPEAGRDCLEFKEPEKAAPVSKSASISNCNLQYHNFNGAQAINPFQNALAQMQGNRPEGLLGGLCGLGGNFSSLFNSNG